MADNYQAKLSELLEKEKALIRKMNTALRAGANSTIIGQFQFMIEECRIAQFEMHELNKANGNSDDKFDDYLSVG